MPMSLHFPGTTRRGGAVAHLSIDNGIVQLLDFVLHSWPPIGSATDRGNQESSKVLSNASTCIYCENLTDTSMCITELAVITRNRNLVSSFNEGDSVWLSMKRRSNSRTKSENRHRLTLKSPFQRQPHCIIYRFERFPSENFYRIYMRLVCIAHVHFLPR
ncbi:hypothetical protein GcC1_110025 [Golovinomyces cichoracearum]|uniref:Uncharacterized protein n=1 Tax=Golovinomyces cichoracearum TaxID=62708 RepID=A0A420I8Y8_9PEZI|nr:hypothetical protein GcC1_110025 [Golovinomyces cichoracearum]